MQPFGDLCLNVYFSEGHSQFDSIIVNAGLYSLCWDYAHGSDILLDEKQEYLSYSQVCRENLETRLANLPLHLPTTSTAIAALLFGVSNPRTKVQFSMDANQLQDISCNQHFKASAVLDFIVEGIRVMPDAGLSSNYIR